MQRNTQEKQYVINEATRLIEEGVVIEKTDSDTVQSKINEMKEFYKTDISEIKNDREKQYENALAKRAEFYEFASNIRFNFILSRSLYLFLKKMIKSDMEYNRETNVYAIDVYEDFFCFDNETSPSKADIAECDDVKITEVNDNIFYTFKTHSTIIFKISHLTSGFTVKGITDKSYKMRQLYQLITNISNIIEYYNIIGEDLTRLFENWRNGFVKYDNEDEQLELTETDSI